MSSIYIPPRMKVISTQLNDSARILQLTRNYFFGACSHPLYEALTLALPELLEGIDRVTDALVHVSLVAYLGVADGVDQPLLFSAQPTSAPTCQK